MKNRLFILILAAAVILSALCGCSSVQTEEIPDLGINWDSVIAEISEAELSEFGLFAEMDSLKSEAEELGTVTFCNYDPCREGAFREVDYQLSVSYGAGCEAENGAIFYYDEPVCFLFLSDNHSDRYYACTCSEDSALLSQEGEWFLDEDRDAYISACIENCRSVLFSD